MDWRRIIVVEAIMSWMDGKTENAVAWLLELDTPGVRYLTLRDLLDHHPDDSELVRAKEEACQKGPIAAVLAEMEQAGYWVEPGPGYRPKYHSTVWSLIMLAQLGASSEMDERITRACAYLLDHALTPAGQFTTSGTPSGTADCLQGNLCWALVELGSVDQRLESAFEWMARTVTGEGIAPATERQESIRYYAGNCGPVFACGSNNKLPCAWGAAKTMLAFGVWPDEKRSPLIKRAIHTGLDFLLGTDPAEADYPHGYSDKPSGNWWKFGFPVFYVTDILQVVEACVGLGCADDLRLANALTLVREKQDKQGRWPLEYSYSGKTWVDFGPKKQSNKWVTLRALRTLKAAA